MENSKPKYIASCSFGKDSIATILIALERGEPVNEAVYCEVMFDSKTSAEIPEHRDFMKFIRYFLRLLPILQSILYSVPVCYRSTHNALPSENPASSRNTSIFRRVFDRRNLSSSFQGERRSRGFLRVL